MLYLRFQSWFASILPHLEPDMPVVMDNAPYHSLHAEASRRPTTKMKKDNVVIWLQKKGIVGSMLSHKPSFIMKQLFKSLHVVYVLCYVLLIFQDYSPAPTRKNTWSRHASFDATKCMWWMGWHGRRSMKSSACPPPLPSQPHRIGVGL